MIVDVHEQRRLHRRGFGQSIAVLPVKDPGQMEIFHQIRHMTGADQILPNQIRGIIRFLLQELQQTGSRLLTRKGGQIVIILEKCPPLEEGAIPIPDGFHGHGNQRVVGHTVVQFPVHVAIPQIAGVGEEFGHNRFVQTDSRIVIVQFRKILPEFPERLRLQQSAPNRIEVGLNMLRNIAVGVTFERIHVLHPLMGCDTPEVHFPGRHGLKHRRHIADRSEQGIVGDDHFIIVSQRIKTHMGKAGFHAPGIKTGIFPAQHLAAQIFQLRTAFLVDCAVAHNNQAAGPGRQRFQEMYDISIHYAVLIVDGINTQTVTGNGHRRSFPVHGSLADVGRPFPICGCRTAADSSRFFAQKTLCDPESKPGALTDHPANTAGYKSERRSDFPAGAGGERSNSALVIGQIFFCPA